MRSSSPAAGAEAIAVDDAAEPGDDEGGEEKSATLANRDQAATLSKLDAKDARLADAMELWSYTPICSTRRLEARASHRIASSRSWRDHCGN